MWPRKVCVAARAIGGYLQQRQIGQFPGPVRDLVVQVLAVQPFFLPDGIVATLHGQFRKRCSNPPAMTVVKSGQLVCQNADGPAIRHDVVDRHQEHMLLIVQAEQPSANQAALWQGRTAGVPLRLQVLRRVPGVLFRCRRGGRRMATGPSTREEITCTGTPSSTVNTVRSDSWRATISLRARSKISTRRGPCSRNRTAMLYAVFPGWS